MAVNWERWARAGGIGFVVFVRLLVQRLVPVGRPVRSDETTSSV